MEGKIFHCPFCPWAAEVEDEEDEDGRAVVRCGREECGKVSCRKCKKGDHGKKSCEEVEADQKIGDIHKVRFSFGIGFGVSSELTKGFFFWGCRLKVCLVFLRFCGL